jgi:DNA topoisomerase-1
MNAAVYDTLSVEVTGKSSAHEYLLRASGSLVKFPGFLIVYEEAKDEDQAPSEEEAEARIPSGIAEGQAQKLVRILPEQHFTQPPPRFSEASLVRALEEFGIGRPSTYAPTMAVLQERGYVTRDQKRLVPTETGILVNDMISEHFPNIVDSGFTANMEADLDRIAAGEIQWVDKMREFYGPFAEQVKLAEERMPEMKTGPEPIGRQCSDCGKELVIRWGRYGKFIACSGFPDCRHTEPWLEKIGVKCPKDDGEIAIRKTRKGRVFYGCVNYPACDFTSWKQPMPRPCPECGGLLVIANKNFAQCTQCEEQFPLDQVSVEESAETTA